MISSIRDIKNSFGTSLGRLSHPKVYKSLEEADRYRANSDSRQIILLPEQVIKRQSPELTRIETEKTRQGALIGGRCGWFQTPRIISPNAELGEIHLEKLRNIVPLWHVLRYDDDATDILVRIGRSLAAIHDNLRLPPQMNIPTIPEWAGDYPIVYLHGDFTMFNILVESATRSIWIIDWMVSQAVRPRVGEVGPCYFDVAWFVREMFTQRYFGIAKVDRIEEKIDVFLKGVF